MLTNLRGLISNEVASGAIADRRIVQFSGDDQVAQGTAAGVLYGVSTDVGAADGERIDVQLDGIAPVVYGGAVTRGNRLKSDAQGRAVVAADTAAGIGFAQVTGVAGDIGAVLIDRTTGTAAGA